jgi:hypothetical protein
MTALRTLATAAVLALALSACTHASRATWDTADIASYTITTTVSCFCPELDGPVTVTVVDGKATTATRDGKEIPVNDPTLRGLPLTVEDLFAYIDDSAKADDVSVTYDPHLGYPTSIAVDWRKNAIDDEVTITVTNFQSEE